MKSKYFFLKISIPFAFSYWLFDSAIHYFLYGEFEFEIIPSDFNELWMRCIIFVLLIFFGIFADYHSNKLLKKEKETYEVYKSMVRANHHILNNFLNSMNLFRHEAEDSADFDKNILKSYDKVINDAIIQIKNLENIEKPNKEIIEERYKTK